MNQENEMPSEIRLLLGLSVGVLVGIAMGQGVDLIRNPVSVTASVLSVIVGFISAYLLKRAHPRREKPSGIGNTALLLLLASYLVIGKLIWTNSHVFGISLYAVAGVILVWLVFTSTAEPSLLLSFCVGGFGGGFGGILALALFSAPFSPLMDVVSTADQSLVRLYIALICTIPGAFAAVAARMSGWGLMGHMKEEVWAFDKDGRRLIKLSAR